ncbi:unnamed protein product [Euphydryas editha]|uniref:Integrase catalytic domain-containing protein n=1 Tax=Euphydryas editha TaxID=104508 RepID=A0AAU9V830_EUPED|nr:unnamed protein product [Euphydryas editha]
MTAVSLLCIAILRVCSSISFVVASTEADKTTDCITTVVGVVDTGLCVPGHRDHSMRNTVMNPQPPSLCLDDDDCLACLSLCLVDSHDARSLSGEEKTHHVTDRKQPRLKEGLPDCTRYSSWNRLRYTTARVLQFIELCRANTQRVNYKRTKKSALKDPDWKRTNKKLKTRQKIRVELEETLEVHPVSAELIRKAEDLFMRTVQEESFPNEVESIKDGKSFTRNSRLKQLSIECAERALRVRSRINAAEQLSTPSKNPMILDRNHHTVKLWIIAMHRTRHHTGVEATVNECRQHYWILRLRPGTRTLFPQCLHCRIRAAIPPHPRTGDLPACRLAHHQRPFTYTGVDYFRPLTVTVGRSQQKRYVAVFTCLTVRTIHLEIATSLSTDSVIMNLRRMKARRGQPAQIWSDNGNNLRGADNELRQAMDRATSSPSSLGQQVA